MHVRLHPPVTRDHAAEQRMPTWIAAGCPAGADAVRLGALGPQHTEPLALC